LSVSSDNESLPLVPRLPGVRHTTDITTKTQLRLKQGTEYHLMQVEELGGTRKFPNVVGGKAPVGVFKAIP